MINKYLYTECADKNNRVENSGSYTSLAASKIITGIISPAHHRIWHA